jgi:hypothetical protein
LRGCGLDLWLGAKSCRNRIPAHAIQFTIRRIRSAQESADWVGKPDMIKGPAPLKHSMLSDQYPDIPRSPLQAAVGLLISALGMLALVTMALRQ